MISQPVNHLRFRHRRARTHHTQPVHSIFHGALFGCGGRRDVVWRRRRRLKDGEVHHHRMGFDGEAFEVRMQGDEVFKVGKLATQSVVVNLTCLFFWCARGLIKNIP